MVEIHPFEQKDIGELASLMSDWGDGFSITPEALRVSLDRVLADGKTRVIVAHRDGRVVGYAQYAERFFLGFEPAVEVMQLLVSVAERSSGIGLALMTHIEDETRKQGICAVNLSSQVHRSRAHVFYERQGYEMKKVSKFYCKNL
ncbi:MAG TPA: GNAT family N-acetyltransferase [Spirochaetota bacterium]|nr:GNAT family N-acetyltransferase [Spirochaetota bacterium]